MSVAYIMDYQPTCYATRDEMQVRRKATQVAVLEQLTIDAVKTKRLTEKLCADLFPTYTTVSRALIQLANDSKAVHLDDGRWATWTSSLGIRQRALNFLRQKVRCGGVRTCLPSSVKSMARALNVGEQALLANLETLRKDGVICRDRGSQTSWWVETGTLEIYRTVEKVQITIMNQDEVKPYRRRIFRRTEEGLAFQDEHYGTLEEAFLSML